eukprot:961842-Amphidinium_carterae.1
MSACEKASEWQRAIQLAENMKSRAMDNNVITYTVSMSALTRGSRWRDAVELLLDMDGQDRNELAFSAALAACSEGAAPELAWHIKEEMEAAGCMPFYTTYVHLLNAAGRAGQHEKTRMLLDEVVAYFAGSDNFNTLELYTLAIVRCAEQSEAQEREHVGIGKRWNHSPGPKVPQNSKKQRKT